MSKNYAILVKDVQGLKEVGVLTVIDYPLVYENVIIPAGALLECLSSADVSAIKTTYKFEANYTVYSSDELDQSGVLLFASPDKILKLTTKQRDLLLGVHHLPDRVEVLKKLEWVEFLMEGSAVYTTIATIPIPVKGVIKYIGELSGTEGTKFGIELMVRVHVFRECICMHLFGQLSQHCSWKFTLCVCVGTLTCCFYICISGHSSIFVHLIGV